MAAQQLEFTRRGEIRFDRRTPESQQALAAVELLGGRERILEVSQAGPYSITLAYDLREISLSEIEAVLSELDFKLDTRLLLRLKRAISRYTEDVARQHLVAHPQRGIARDVQRVYVSRYLHRRHGCRDAKPRGWREYH